MPWFAGEILATCAAAKYENLGLQVQYKAREIIYPSRLEEVWKCVLCCDLLFIRKGLGIIRPKVEAGPVLTLFMYMRRVCSTTTLN